MYLASADPATLNDFTDMFANIVSASLGLVGILLFIFLLIGGFKYITSGGDPKNAEAAKKTITYAILGVVLAASAVLIMQIIASITGQTQWSVFRIFIPPTP